MTKLRLVRGSEVGSFLADRKAWKLRWVDHLVKNKQDGKLFFGTIFHKYMELKYTLEHRMNVMNAFNQWMDEQDTTAMDAVFYQDMMELFWKVVNHYDECYLQDKELKVIATELRFAIPLYDGEDTLSFAYEGTIDLIYSDDGVNLKFMDHKTVSSIDRYVANAVLDRQISRYWWALTALREGAGYVWEDEQWKPVRETVFGTTIMGYKPVSEFVYNLIKKAAPEKPRLLKSKGLSKAKDQNTTLELYMEAIHEHGLDPADYEEMIHILAQGNKFVRRITVRRNWSECTAAMEDFAKVAREMLAVREEVENGNEDHIYWNITWDTPTFNAYYPLIQAEVMGENVSMVQAALYTTEEWEEGENFIEVGD